jgi:hypothetical protein
VRRLGSFASSGPAELGPDAARFTHALPTWRTRLGSREPIAPRQTGAIRGPDCARSCPSGSDDGWLSTRVEPKTALGQRQRDGWPVEKGRQEIGCAPSAVRKSRTTASRLTMSYLRRSGAGRGQSLLVHAIIPPLSLCGPTLNIRKFSPVPFTPQELLARGTLGPRTLAFLEACVRGRANVIVSGGTSSGKTTLLGVLSTFVPDEERLLTIEALRAPPGQAARSEARSERQRRTTSFPTRLRRVPMQPLQGLGASMTHCG